MMITLSHLSVCERIVAVFRSGTKFIRQFILDEADEMLSRGFKDQIYDVFRTLSDDIQVKETRSLLTRV